MDYHHTPLDQLITEGLVIQTEFSRNKAKSFVPSCYTRGLQAKENLCKRQQLAKEQQQVLELKELTAAPSLCPNSVRLAGKRGKVEFSEYARRWKQDRDQKVTISRLEESIQGGALPRSQSPLPAPPGYKSPVRDWKSRVDHYQSIRSVTPEPASFRPELAPGSRKLTANRGNEPPEVRFQRLEVERVKRLQVERQKADESLTGSLSFKPVTNGGQGQRPGDVSLYLYEVGVEELKKKREMVETSLPEGCTFKPELNLNSAELAQRHRMKTPPPKSGMFEAPLPGAKGGLTPDQLSDFLARNYTNPTLRAKAVAKPQGEDPECTFYPSLNESVSAVRTGNVYERSMEHLKTVQAKITSTRVKLTQESHSPHKLSDSYSSTLHLDDAMSRKSTLSTIDPESKRASITYINGRKEEFQLAVRCYDGCPGVIEDMEDIQSSLREVGIDW